MPASCRPPWPASSRSGSPLLSFGPPWIGPGHARRSPLRTEQKARDLIENTTGLIGIRNFPDVWARHRLFPQIVTELMERQALVPHEGTILELTESSLAGPESISNNFISIVVDPRLKPSVDLNTAFLHAVKHDETVFSADFKKVEDWEHWWLLMIIAEVERQALLGGERFVCPLRGLLRWHWLGETFGERYCGGDCPIRQWLSHAAEWRVTRAPVGVCDK